MEIVHLTPERNARRILRAGLAARSAHRDSEHRGVYGMPVLPSFTLTFQWTRELRRWHAGPFVAVQARIPDDEPVWVGHYNEVQRRLTAVRAAGVVGELADPRGWQLFVPRAILAGEIRRVRSIPPGVGWRYKPDAHGSRPCTCPVCDVRGGFGAAKLRQRFPDDDPPVPKLTAMAALRAATSGDEIVDALQQLGTKRRGGAEELEYLADHPDPEVLLTLVWVLHRYRGRAAVALRRRVEQVLEAIDV